MVMVEVLSPLLVVIALSIATVTRPWRWFAWQAVRESLLTPLLACLVLMPLLWSLPRLHDMPLGMQLSGACLVVLLLGWPLAVWVITGIAAMGAIVAPAPLPVVIDQLAWYGLVPATLALGVGVVIRRTIGENPFLYILGRGFLGTAFAFFVAGVLHNALGPPADASAALLPANVAVWLMAWGDAFITGMLAAVFVCCRPRWLATWSDAKYLRPR